jgi:hypothetical protein
MPIGADFLQGIYGITGVKGANTTPTYASRPYAATESGTQSGTSNLAGTVGANAALNAREILARIAASNASAQASLASARSAADRNGIDLQKLREDARQFDIANTEGRRQFDLKFGIDTQRLQLDYRRLAMEEQQAKLAGAQTILNAPRGPADFFAYAARALPAAQAGGSFLENIFGKALENISGESLGQLRQGPVLTNTQLATDMVKASQGGEVSPETATFLKRSLGVSVPPAGTAAAQQAQAQQPAPGAAAAVPGAPPAVPTGYVPDPTKPPDWYPGRQWQWDQNRGDWFYATQPDDFGVTPQAIAEMSATYSPYAKVYATEAYPMRMGYLDQMKREAEGSVFPVTGMGGGGYKGSPAPIFGSPGARGSMAVSPPGTPAPIGATNYTPIGGGGMGGGSAANPVLDAILGGGRSFMQRLGGLQLPTGYQTSIQEYNRLAPSVQAMYAGLLGETGLQTQEDFLSGLVKAAPTFGSSRAARLR